MAQTKVWAASASTVLRVGTTGSPKQGDGGSKRLYVGRHSGFDYTSWVKFAVDYTDVGKVIQATLILYTNDFTASLDPDPTAANRSPAITVNRGDSGFPYVGSSPDTTFAAGDYSAGHYTTVGSKVAGMAPDSAGVTRIDITDFANLWAPKTVTGSDGKAGGGLPGNQGLALTPHTIGPADRFWNGWSQKADLAQFRPSIELVYEYGLTAPDVPGSLTPIGAVASISAFTGTFSDRKRGDQLYYSEVEVYTAGVSGFTGVGSTNRITKTAHGHVNGDIVFVTADTGGPGLPFGTPLYVRNATANDFQVSTTATGAVVDFNDYSAITLATRVYGKRLAESDAARTAAVFNHVPVDLNLKVNTNYQWRARVTDNEGQVSAWTGFNTVSVTNTNPNAPTLTPTGQTYTSLDGVMFRGGTFSDPDAGDTLRAYEVQLSAYPSGSPNWDDPSFILWGTGKRYVASGSTSWETPYGGATLAAGAYYWRARQWDNHDGVSNWTYAPITLSADFQPEPNYAPTAVHARPKVPWRILIKEMEFIAVGGALTGTASTDVLTTATAHGFRAGRKVRFLSLTGGAGLFTGTDYYVIASGLTTTAFKVSTTLNGAAVDFTTNVTAGSVGAIVTRGPGNVVAVIEDAYNAGASMLYNSPGEAHFTLSASHPQLSVIEPKQTHYAIEFRQGDGWREAFAGLVWDVDATNPDVIIYGIDYLALLDFCLDTRYDPSNADKDYTKGGSKYSNVSIKNVILDQFNVLRHTANYPIGFIGVGAIATMDETVTVYSTYEPGLNFIAGLLDSHRAGSGKRTRLSVNKRTDGRYEFVIVDDPGVLRPELRLRYGELVQAYRVVPFGKTWASRVSAVGRDKNGVKVRYTSQVAPGIDETVWGRFDQPQFIDGVNDANDFTRRVRQAVLSASKLGKQMGLGIRSNFLNPRDGYDLCDQFYVDVVDQSINTNNFGSGIWCAVGITWQALTKGQTNTTLTLQPREDSTAPSSDLLVTQPLSTQAEWQIGWQPPTAVTPTSRYYLDQSTGIAYNRVDGTLVKVGITGDV